MEGPPLQGLTPTVLKMTKQLNQLKMISLSFIADPMQYFREIATEDEAQPFASPHWTRILKLYIHAAREPLLEVGAHTNVTRLLEGIRLSLKHVPRVERLQICMENQYCEVQEINILGNVMKN